jgi:hypothetical protein
MKHTVCIWVLLVLLACGTTKPTPVVTIGDNRSGLGFDEKNSDAKAIAIADEVMRAQGGFEAWSATRYIKWDFFGSRTLIWDKHGQRVNIQFKKKPLKIIADFNLGTTRVWLNDAAQTHPDSLEKYHRIANEVLINDSYWLVMPFKLKDTGVTLKYLGASATQDGKPSDLLQMTFKNVGVTPDNKYHVWVDQTTRLVSQWAFFEKYTDEKPRFTNPWADYQKYGNILLSSSRGEGRMGNIEVLETVPVGIF